MNEAARAIQRRSARLRRYVTWLWAIALVIVVLERFSAAAIEVVAAGFSGSSLRRLACQGVSAFPEALFLLGLWWVRGALAAFARGELFAPTIGRMLGRVGVVLAVGAAMRIAVVPGLCRLVGFGPGYWIAFDTSALVLGSFGLSLRAISAVLQHASTIKSELDEMF